MGSPKNDMVTIDVVIRILTSQGEVSIRITTSIVNREQNELEYRRSQSWDEQSKPQSAHENGRICSLQAVVDARE
jgi:hypothetical protein